MNQPAHDPLIGHLIDGRYRVDAHIAWGGMGTVYRAHDERLDRDVALKVMHPHIGINPEAGARFRREARAVAKLNHPQVVAVYDQGIDGTISYLALEFIDGQDLRQLLKCRGSLSLDDALRVTHQVLDALAAAHRAEIIHRDIKPENVLITSDARIKVTDFGLARAVTNATSSATQSLMGSVAYIAPELVLHGQADARGDVYATGILLYEMLTGRQPFTGSSPIQVAYQHVNESIPALTVSHPNLPIELEEFISILTARDPTDRPVDAGQALTALVALVDELGTSLGDLHLSPGAIPAVLAPAEGSRTTAPCAHTSAVAAAADPEDKLPTAIQSKVDHTVSQRLATLDSGSLGPQTTPATITGRFPAVTIAGSRSDSRERDTESLRSSTADATAPVQEQIASTGSALARHTRPGPRRRRWRLLMSLLIVLLTAATGVGWYFIWGPGAYTTVPAVAGLDQDDAERILDAASISHTTTYENHDDVSRGQVISTDPGTDVRIHRGSSVTIIISSGVLMVEIPVVAGSSMEAAQDSIKLAGFTNTPTVTESYHPSVPAGQVIDSTPEAGQVVPHSEALTLMISLGREPVELPEIVNSSRERALTTLEDARLEVGEITEVHHDSVPEGAVISVSAPDLLYVGDTVDLVISMGPELVEVPNMRGRQYSAAAAELADLGFDVERQNYLGGIFGTVHSQSLEPGSMQPRGSTIVLNVV